jgi:L-fucose isomerase-like protein
MSKNSGISIGFFSTGITGAFDARTASSNFRKAGAAFKKLAAECGFRTVALESPIYSRRELQSFMELCADERVSAVVLHTASFTSGEIGQELAWHAGQRSLPVLIWGVPERAGGPLPVNNLCCANFMASIFHAQGVPYKWAWGAPGSANVCGAIADTAAAVRGMAALRGAVIGVVGSGRVPGFYGSNFDETAIKSRFGVSARRIPLTEFYKLFKSASGAKVKAAAGRIRASAGVIKATDEEIARSARAFVALRDLAADNECSALAVRCWPEMRDDLAVEPCLPMALLTDEGILCSCEADVPGLLTMMLQHALTNGEAGPPALLDMVSLDPAGKFAGLWHCGVSSPSLCDKGAACICRHSIVGQFDPAAPAGLVYESAMKPGDATLCRLQGDDAGRYLAVEGRVLKRKPEFRGSYAPFAPNGMSAADLVNTAMVQGLTHHYSLAYTRHAGRFAEAAYWLGLEPIEPVPASAPGAALGRV